MGEAWGWGEYLDETTNEMVHLLSYVQFGYQLPSETDENTYIGINFEVTCPEEHYVEGATIINWAKYTLYDDAWNETEESYAVACIIEVGNVDATAVKFYENTADISSMDDDELESLERDSPWELADLHSEYYAPEYLDIDGAAMVRQPCLVKQEWSAPDASRRLQKDNYDYY